MGCVLAERADPSAAGYAAEAIELCRRGGSAEQLAATLPTAAMVCWQVGDLDAARRYVAEAQPLLGRLPPDRAGGAAVGRGRRRAGRRRPGAAIELGHARPTGEATDLGIERELPLVRCRRGAGPGSTAANVATAARQARGRGTGRARP